MPRYECTSRSRIGSGPGPTWPTWDAPRQAALLLEEAVILFRAIGERYGLGIALESQAAALWALEARGGALAAWWLARELFRAIGGPATERFDGLFAQVERGMEPGDYQALMTDLEAHAEERRAEAVARLGETAGADLLLLEVQGLLEPLRGG